MKMKIKSFKSSEELQQLIMQDVQCKIYNIYDKSDVEYTKKESPDKTLCNFLSWLVKLIPAVKRKVHFSDTLKNSPYLTTLKKYEEYFNNGEDMNPYLSKKVMQIKQLDYLQLNWHIYHLHLNATMSKKRSNLLLLCIINQYDVFFIDVISHPSKYTPEEFLKLDFLETIYRNGWMKEIGFVELKGLEPLTSVKDSKGLFNLYTKGVNTTFEFGGKCFAQGDSISLSKSSLTVIDQKDIIYNNIKKISVFAIGYIGFDFCSDKEGRLYGLVTFLAHDNTIKRYNILSLE